MRPPASSPRLATVLVRVCLVGFFINCQPSEPFLTKYLETDKNLTEAQLDNEVWPYDSYGSFLFLPLVGLLADGVGYRSTILLGLLARQGTRVLLLFGQGVRLMAVMQVTYALATSVNTVYLAYAFVVVEPKVFPLAAAAMHAASHAGNFFGSVTGQLLVSYAGVGSDLRVLFYLSWAFSSAGLACFFLLLPRPLHRQPPSVLWPLLRNMPCGRRGTSTDRPSVSHRLLLADSVEDQDEEQEGGGEERERGDRREQRTQGSRRQQQQGPALSLPPEESSRLGAAPPTATSPTTPTTSSPPRVRRPGPARIARWNLGALYREPSVLVWTLWWIMGYGASNVVINYYQTLFLTLDPDAGQVGTVEAAMELASVAGAFLSWWLVRYGGNRLAGERRRGCQDTVDQEEEGGVEADQHGGDRGRAGEQDQHAISAHDHTSRATLPLLANLVVLMLTSIAMAVAYYLSSMLRITWLVYTLNVVAVAVYNFQYALAAATIAGEAARLNVHASAGGGGGGGGGVAADMTRNDDSDEEEGSVGAERTARRAGAANARYAVVFSLNSFVSLGLASIVLQVGSATGLDTRGYYHVAAATQTMVWVACVAWWAGMAARCCGDSKRKGGRN